MKHTALLLHITLLLAVGFAGCAQKYDDPRDYDFNIEHEGDTMDVQVTGYRGAKTAIRIPPTFEDYDINVITEEAFAGKGLTGVVIPDGIYYIKSRAFADNMLTEVTIPPNVSFIASEAFAHNQLTGITIPDGVSIYSGAFKGNAITRITIGANAYITNANEEYEEEAALEFDFVSFYEANKKRAGIYTYHDGRWSMHHDIVQDGFAAVKIGNGRTAKIIDYLGPNTDISIPVWLGKFRITEIDHWAFFDKGLTSVTIPPSLIVIGENSFAKNKLADIAIPGSIKNIATGAFADNELVSVNLGRGVITIGRRAFAGNKINHAVIASTVKKIEGEAFLGNMLMSITIPPGVTSIGYGSFLENQLTGVVIPNSVTTIWDKAFARNRLASVTLSNGLTRIGSEAFADNQLTGVIIPDSVTSIEGKAFRGNQITGVVIPNNVIGIGKGAFDDAVVLEYIYDDEKDFAIEIYEENAAVITGYNGSKKYVKIPPYINNMPVIGIGADAFMQKILRGVLIPDTIAYIGDRAFFYGNLHEVTIPGNVSHIFAGAFYHNYIREITIPHSVAVIEDWAFADNRYEKITIGALVTVHKNAFPNGFADFYNRINKKAGTYQFDDKSKRWKYSGDEETNAFAVAAAKERVTEAKPGPWNNIEQPSHPMDRYDASIVFANEAIKRDPEDSYAWLNRGRARERNNDREGAIADFTEAIRLSPQWSTCWFYRGYTYLKMGENDQAIVDYTEVIRLDPDDKSAYNNRAVAYNRKGDKERALADIDRALALEPDDETAKENRDIILNGPRLQLWFQ